MACTLPPIRRASCCVTRRRPSNGISGHPRTVSKASWSGRPSAMASVAAFFNCGPDPNSCEGTNLLVGRRNVSAERKTAAGKAGEGHADHALYHSAMEAVAGVFCFARSALNPTCAATGFVSGGEILLRERLAGAEQFDTASPSCVPVVHASSTPEPVSMLVEPEPSPMRA